MTTFVSKPIRIAPKPAHVLVLYSFPIGGLWSSPSPVLPHDGCLPDLLLGSESGQFPEREGGVGPWAAGVCTQRPLPAHWHSGILLHLSKCPLEVFEIHQSALPWHAPCIWLWLFLRKSCKQYPTILRMEFDTTVWHQFDTIAIV